MQLQAKMFYALKYVKIGIKLFYDCCKKIWSTENEFFAFLKCVYDQFYSKMFCRR